MQRSACRPCGTRQPRVAGCGPGDSYCCTLPLYRRIEVESEMRLDLSDLRFSRVGVAGFEPTTSSSRTRVDRDDQYRPVPSRARESPRRVLWWHPVTIGS